MKELSERETTKSTDRVQCLQRRSLPPEALKRDDSRDEGLGLPGRTQSRAGCGSVKLNDMCLEHFY